MSDEDRFPGWLVLAIMLAAALVAMLAAYGCVAPDAVSTRLDTLSASVSAALADVDAVRGDMAAIKAEVRVGGGADSVTAWLYAAIAGAALLYPMIWRPARRWAERRRPPEKNLLA